uniref:Oclussion derived viral envelope 56 protein n=1 Tax=Lymantria dispar multicapsid nuclear polyhedrosis virus TaxID=10449 RepID=A0A1B1MQZ2_NPVLD|nr:oclussion derived viral envelope 56 protein [Lymantria dispar multiple nucleopolyhedrovirus]
MSFFSSLRRVKKVYPNAQQFTVVDNLSVLNSTPNGFQNVFTAPSVRQIGNNRFVPGYNLTNNRFVSTSDINRVMRNNDTGGIRNIFTNANNNQIDSLGQLRRVDNIPDAGLHAAFLRRQATKSNFPSTNTRTNAGVESALADNPRLHNRLSALKTAGVSLLIGGGVYLVFSAATLVQDIVAALNRVGGSYYVVGNNGGETSSVCLLMERTCQLPADLNDVNVCQFDPLLPDDPTALRNICNGFDYEREESVCRASDPYADPDSLQYVDISDLPAGHTLMCLEPYNLGDLIGDLGLDHLLGEEGLVVKSSNSGKQLSDKLWPLLLAIVGIGLVLLVLFFVFKRLWSSSSSSAPPQQIQITPVNPPPPPPLTTMAGTTTLPQQ